MRNFHVEPHQHISVSTEYRVYILMLNENFVYNLPSQHISISVSTEYQVYASGKLNVGYATARVLKRYHVYGFACFGLCKMVDWEQALHFRKDPDE